MADARSRAPATSVILLACLCFAMFFRQLGAVPFYVRGEPREGLVVQAMRGSSEWILPAVNGSYIPFKPPLFHWIAAIVSAAFGRVDEFTLRFPSALLAALGVFLVYFAGVRLWTEKTGLVAGAVLATSHQWWIAASLVQVDTTLAFFMTAGLLVFLFTYRRQDSDIGFAGPCGIAVLLASATLAKGPIGIVLPALVIFCFLLLRRNLVFIKKLHPLSSAIVFCLVAGSWYGLALWKGGEAFFRRQIVNETINTAVGTYGHYQAPFYFVSALLLNMMPWSLFFPAAAWFAWRERRWTADERVSYLLVWLATVFIFFSIARGKRAIYILPLYPAAALLIGAWWAELEESRAELPWLASVPAYAGAIFWMLVPGAFIVRALGWDLMTVLRPSRAAQHVDLPLVLNVVQAPSALLWTLLLLTAVAGCVIIVSLAKKHSNVLLLAFAVGAAATGLVIKQVYYPSLAAERTLKPFMVRVRTVVDKERAPLFLFRAFDYGAVFYAARHVEQYPARPPFPAPPFYLLMWEEEWDRLPDFKALQRLDASEGVGAARRHHMLLVRVETTPDNLKGKAIGPDDED